MRLGVAIIAILTVAASTRGGCDGGQPSDVPAYGCEGLSCGDPCGSCPPGTPPEHCPVPTFAPTACDAHGECVTAGTFRCVPEDDCAGKACGAECTVTLPCHHESPPCLAPVRLGACTAYGACVTDPVVCEPVADCAGQPCGVPCDRCGGLCMHPYATACDPFGACVPAVPWLCYDPCAGKACGDECRLCPPDASGCFETTELKACDPTGRCVSWTPGLACP